MDKIYRDGADIVVAFASGRRHNAIAASAAAISGIASLSNESSGQDCAAAMSDAVAVRPQATVKHLLRRLARGIYRVVRPIAKPIAYRVRGFMMTGQIQRMEQYHSEAAQRLLATEQALRAEIEGTRAILKKEAQNTHSALTSALIAEMKYTRDFLNEGKAKEGNGNQADLNRIEQRLDRIEAYAVSAARRDAVQCGVDEILVRTAVGYMLCPAHDHALLAQLLDVGELEAGTRMLIQRVLRPGSSYIDVGANIGMHTVAAARAMQGKGSIVCFEPYEPTVRLLEKSIFLNGYNGIVQVHQAAVAAQSGSQALFLGNTSGHHSLFSLPDRLASQAPLVQTRVVTLDETMPPGSRVDLIKIDVEGSELDVLDGASRLLNENPDAGLIVECGLTNLLRAGSRLEDWLGRFQSAGFAWKAISPDNGHLEAWSAKRISDSASVNLFMARTDASVWRLAEYADE